MSFFLLAGIVPGILILLIYAFAFGSRGASKTWRGLANAFGAGIILGALVDLLPKALSSTGVLVAAFLQAQVIAPLHAPPDGILVIGAEIIAQAVTPAGALLVLFLYLGGNSAPMPVDGKIVGARSPGWRTRISIPAAGQVDWKGVVIITFGLSVHNLWLGEARGALAQVSNPDLTPFFIAFGLIATLRAIALVGSLVDSRRRWLTLLGCALVIGGSGVLGVTKPEFGNTLVLGFVPVLVAALVLPVELGRLLRVMEYDLGLGWKTTVGVLAGLGVERLASYLILALVQGQLGLPQ